MNQLTGIQSILDESKEEIGDEKYLSLCNLTLEMAKELENTNTSDFYKVTYLRTDIVMVDREHYKACIRKNSCILHLRKNLAEDAISCVETGSHCNMPIHTIENMLDLSVFNYTAEFDDDSIDLYINNSLRIIKIEKVPIQ